jgi:RND superfamily putative drug exporter
VLDFTTDGTIQAWLPIVAFAILFGISMDYEVFLLSRMREEWDRTGDNRAAVRAGLRHTARPITSAAAIQIAVFGAFIFTRVPEVQQLGFALATAIAIDATLVRIVLVPAAMRLMGRANWWTPRWLPRPRPHNTAHQALTSTPTTAPAPNEPHDPDLDERALLRSVAD